MEKKCISSENCGSTNNDRLTIAEFLVGKNIFITGGTGFLGTILIERLLSATPNIGKIYVLIRQKNGYTPESRIEHLLSKIVSRVVAKKSRGSGWNFNFRLMLMIRLYSK
jgi:Male sterility protein